MPKINRVNGKAGAEIRWSNYREHLIDEVRKLATKEQLDFFLIVSPFTKPGSYQKWREALMELRRRKNEKNLQINNS